MSIFEIADAGIEAAERRREQGDAATLLWYHELPDERAIYVYAMLFNARVCIGPIGSSVYDEGYCYTAPAGALLAAAKYAHADGKGEPEGWMKNLQTGEFRS